MKLLKTREKIQQTKKNHSEKKSAKIFKNPRVRNKALKNNFPAKTSARLEHNLVVFRCDAQVEGLVLEESGHHQVRDEDGGRVGGGTVENPLVRKSALVLGG